MSASLPAERAPLGVVQVACGDDVHAAVVRGCDDDEQVPTGVRHREHEGRLAATRGDPAGTGVERLLHLLGRHPVPGDVILGLLSPGDGRKSLASVTPVSYTHLRAHETRHDL